MYMDSNSCRCQCVTIFSMMVLYMPIVPTNYAAHDLKLLMRRSSLLRSSPVPQGPTGCSRAGYLSTTTVLVRALSPSIEQFRQFRDPILAALGQEKVFL